MTRFAGHLATVALILAVASEAVCARPGDAPPAAGFRVVALSDEKLELDVLRRRGPVLIDFWATWCKPCITALPGIEALHRRYAARGLTVVGVSVDGPRNYSKVRPFVNRLGLSYPIVLDQDGALQSAYQVRAMPTTVLIDTSGTIARVVQGYRPGETEALAAAIEKLLPASTPPDSAARPAPDPR